MEQLTCFVPKELIGDVGFGLGPVGLEAFWVPKGIGDAPQRAGIDFPNNTHRCDTFKPSSSQQHLAHILECIPQKAELSAFAQPLSHSLLPKGPSGSPQAFHSFTEVFPFPSPCRAKETPQNELVPGARLPAPWPLASSTGPHLYISTAPRASEGCLGIFGSGIPRGETEPSCLSIPICKTRALLTIPNAMRHRCPERNALPSNDSILGEKAITPSWVICSEHCPQSLQIQLHVCRAVPARGHAEQSPLALSRVRLLVPLSFLSQHQIKSLLLVPFLYTIPCTISE